MDPSRNPALHNAKLETILLPAPQRQGSTSNSYTGAEMPPPPAYHTVVDPTDPLSNMHDPYDPLEDEDKEQDVPEINVNATTQIRGHGNIISIAQMDSMRIANLLAILVHGGLPPQANVQAAQAHAQGQAQPPQEQAQAQPPPPTAAQRPSQERRELPRINININCGATVIGDRNIVGPGLGDIARHMQIAQQRQQQQQQEQQHQHQQQQKQVPVVDPRASQPQRPGFGFPLPVQTSMVTPPMSRSASFGSEGATGVKKEDSGGVKRKAEEHGESPTKRSR